MSTMQASRTNALPVTRRAGSGMTARTLLSFLALTFGLTWGLAALAMLFPDQVFGIFPQEGLSNPLIIVAVYAPGIAGVLLVLRHYGLRGLGSFVQRLTLWRAPLRWWLFLLVGIPAVVYAGAAIKGTFGEPFAFSPWYQALPAMAFALVLGPIEEFGWRGLALPLLQRKLAAVWAGLLLGLIWALWHIPSFMISGMPQSTWSVVPYFVGIIAISVIMTPFFNASRGSLLLAMLYHFQMMNPIWPDAQPYDNLLYVALAVVVVWLNRRSMFQRGGSAVTDVLMPEDGAASSPGLASS